MAQTAAMPRRMCTPGEIIQIAAVTAQSRRNATPPTARPTVLVQSKEMPQLTSLLPPLLPLPLPLPISGLVLTTGCMSGTDAQASQFG